MQRWLRMSPVRIPDLIDKIKSGDVTGFELDEKSMHIPFKTFPADRISDDHTVEDRIWNAEVAMREEVREDRGGHARMGRRECRNSGSDQECEMNHDITQQMIYRPCPLLKIAKTHDLTMPER